MDAPTRDELTKKHCRPCEGGLPALTREQAEAIVRNVEGWTLDPDARRIARSWTVKDFTSAIDFFNKIAAIAEEEDHHPDLHLEGYRKVTIAICDPRHRRPDRERLHPRRQDQRRARGAAEVLKGSIHPGIGANFFLTLQEEPRMRRRTFFGTLAAGAMYGTSPAPLRLGMAGLEHGHASGFLARYRDSREIELVGISEPDRDVAARYVRRYRIDPARSIPRSRRCSTRPNRRR